MKKIKLLPDNIDYCALLTKEDVLAAPKEILKSNSWWWLRTTGFCKYYSLGVTKDGDVDDHDGYIYSVACVRPALYLKEPICETGTRYLLCRRVFVAVSPSVLLYDDTELRSAFTREKKNTDAYNSYEESCVREFTANWYQQFCEDMVRCNGITAERMIIVLHKIIELYAEGRDETDVMKYLCKIGFTSDELDALDYVHYATVMDEIEKERLAHIEDEEKETNVLALLPDKRTVFADWEDAIIKWAKLNNKKLGEKEIDEAAYSLTYTYNQGRNFAQNIASHFSENTAN